MPREKVTSERHAVPWQNSPLGRRMHLPTSRSLEHGPAFVSAAVALTILAHVGDLAVHAQDFEAAKRSIVRIVSTLRSESGEVQRTTGTGFVVRVDSDLVYIVTASHVIGSDPAPLVEFYSRRNRLVTASIVNLEGDDPRGIGLIAVPRKESIPQGLEPLPFATVDELKGGHDVVAIGFGRGQGAWAVIRANVASIDGRDIKLDGRIEEGNSGGPILKDGRVVGLITRAQGGLGLATPASIVELVLRGWGLAVSRSDTLVAPPPPIRPTETVGSDKRYGLRFTATEGRKMLLTSRTELRDGTLTVYGVQQPDRMTIVFSERAESEILLVSNGEITRARKTFLAKSTTFARGAGSQRGGTVPSPLQGRTVIGESWGGQWSYRYPEGALSPADRQELGSPFSADTAYPRDPVPVGHEWEISGSDLHTALGVDTSTTLDGSVKMRLRRIVSCGSEQCAEIETRLRIEALTLTEDGQMHVITEGQGVSLRSLRERIDVSSSLTGQMVYTMSSAAAGINMSVAGPFTTTGAVSPR
jgi:hypothetical protein